jgi:hypothetical protein
MFTASSRLEIAEAELRRHNLEIKRMHDEVSQKAERTELQPFAHISRVDEIDALVKSKQDKTEYLSRDGDIERKIKVFLLILIT